MVHEAIASILEREEYLLDNARNNKLRTITRKLLDEVVVAEKTELFDEKNTFPNSPPPPTMLKEEALREKLWKLFHSLRIGQLPALWQALYAGLGWDDVQESMLEQYTNLESLMVIHFEKSNPSLRRSIINGNAQILDRIDKLGSASKNREFPKSYSVL